MKLYFSRNLNPRLAVAAARFLKLPVEFEFACARAATTRTRGKRSTIREVAPERFCAM
jgi:hypothetical protein